MILPRKAFADAVLHQTGERRQNGHRRIDAGTVQRTVENDLSLRDVAGQIRHRMGNIVIRHGENRNLRDRAFMPLYHAGTFIQRRQVGVQIAGIALSAGDFAF